MARLANFQYNRMISREVVNTGVFKLLHCGRNVRRLTFSQKDEVRLPCIWPRKTSNQLFTNFLKILSTLQSVTLLKIISFILKYGSVFRGNWFWVRAANKYCEEVRKHFLSVDLSFNILIRGYLALLSRTDLEGCIENEARNIYWFVMSVPSLQEVLSFLIVLL